MDKVKVYVLRTDKKGCHYQGYMEELTDDLYVELEIEKGNTECVPVTEELFAVCNKESAVRGYPLNRALYNADYNLITVFGGNMIVMKTVSKGGVDIDSEDVKMLENRLRAVAAVSHGFVFTKDYGELTEWKQ